MTSGRSYRVLRHSESQEHRPRVEPEDALIQLDRGDASGPHLGFQVARPESQPRSALLEGQNLVQTRRDHLAREPRRVLIYLAVLNHVAR